MRVQNNYCMFEFFKLQYFTPSTVRIISISNTFLVNVFLLRYQHLQLSYLPFLFVCDSISNINRIKALFSNKNQDCSFLSGSWKMKCVRSTVSRFLSFECSTCAFYQRHTHVLFQLKKLKLKIIREK